MKEMFLLMYIFIQITKYPKYITFTGKSFSEALASTNPQYDKRLFMELP